MRLLIKNTSDKWKYIGKYALSGGEQKEVTLTRGQYNQLKASRSLEILEEYNQQSEDEMVNNDNEIDESEEEENEEENEEDEENEETDDEVEESKYPKELGGGWFELSDGSKIRGQEEALEVESELEVEGSEE